MDGQPAATPKRTSSDELACLVRAGVTPATLEKCQELESKVLEVLDVHGALRRGGRAILLQEILSSIASDQTRQAFTEREDVTRADAAKTASFQVAAAAELLQLIDKTISEQFVPFRCDQLGEAWPQLLDKDGNRGATSERQLRAALWIGSGSAKTGRRHQAELLEALETMIPGYLENNRDRFRALAVSYLEQRESTGAKTQMHSQPPSTILEPSYAAVEVGSQPVSPVVDPRLWRTIHDMADIIHRQWHEEQSRRKENDPFLLPVRWKNSPKQYAAHWATVRGVPENNEEIALDGVLDEVTKVFKSVPSKRLVILGQGGAGKTTLAIELLLKLLSSAHHSAGDPVPAIFNLASWDPVQQSLRDWITERITVDYQGLNTTIKRHRTFFTQLVYADHVLPVLDGFDEIDPDLRTSAIQALNVYTGTMVMTSRAQEYYDAIDAGDVILSRAAVIVLEDLTLHEISHYLPLATRPLPDETPSRTKWDPVLNHIRSAPDDAHSATLLEVFATPLMLSLARRIYSDTPADPIELLDSTRFPNTATLSDHLFDQFVQVTYDQLPQDRSAKRYGAWRADEAQYRLACFAMYLHSLGVRDLSCFSSEMKKTRSIQAPFPWSVTKLSQRIYRQLVLSKIERDRLKKAYFPRPSKKFLEDAYRRGVLRRSGDNYEFRHVLLQHRLAYKALIGDKKIGKHEFVHDVTRHLAIELFRRGRFAEAENLLRVRLELLCNPPWRRGKLFKRRPAEWSIEYTDIMVIWNMSVVGGGSSGGWVLLPRSARKYL